MKRIRIISLMLALVCLLGLTVAATEVDCDSVYCFTPTGDVKNLPNGSTPIDFAYKIHTDIGNSMIAAIVNDEVVAFDYRLKSNDRVRIVTDNKAFVPKNDWLDKYETFIETVEKAAQLYMLATASGKRINTITDENLWAIVERFALQDQCKKEFLDL